MADLVNIANLNLSYGGKKLFDSLDLQITEESIVGITGPIGSGKSTLLKSLIGLQPISEQVIKVFGHDPSSRDELDAIRKKTGYLFQDSDDQLFCSTVAEDLAFGPLNQNRSHDEVKAAVSTCLEAVGLSGYEDRVIHHLSGGEKRLVALATILIMEPELLLLDEPFVSLDDEAISRISRILSKWKGSVLFVSHYCNPDQVRADEWYTLVNGKLVKR